MAVPKGKVSKQRRNTRRAQTWQLAAPGITECPQCHSPKLTHRICKQCGYYSGRSVVAVDTAK